MPGKAEFIDRLYKCAGVEIINDLIKLKNEVMGAFDETTQLSEVVVKVDNTENFCQRYDSKKVK